MVIHGHNIDELRNRRGTPRRCGGHWPCNAGLVKRRPPGRTQRSDSIVRNKRAEKVCAAVSDLLWALIMGLRTTTGVSVLEER
jgi:hypothetical protein